MRSALTNCRRVVVKIGTSSLIHESGRVNLQAIDRLAYALAAMSNAGSEVVLVTSGAIGVGLAAQHLTSRPAAIAEQQALAAIGQSSLMRLYGERFTDYGASIAQLLLTHDVFDYPASRRHVLDTIDALLARRVIPIINENDSVATDELDHKTTFGDNDQLSALVATSIEADLLIVLSDIEGLFDRNPKQHPNASLIPTVAAPAELAQARATGAGSRFGTGGMVTKLKAASAMMAAGKQMVLCSGADPRIVLKVVAGADVGTWFGKEEAQ